MSENEDPIIRFFITEQDLQEVSRPFCELALWIEKSLPRNAERTVALRKLLESKDAAVRTKL